MQARSDPEAPVSGAGARFFKAHGLGNDYLVFQAGDAWPVTTKAIRAVCQRWEGPGSDGVVLQLPHLEDPLRLRMFNPDGSEFERSGNGLRVFAAYLAAEGRVGAEPFQVEVGGDVVTMQVHDRSTDGEYDVSVQMGRASLGPTAVGLDSAPLDPAGRLHLASGALEFTAVSIGNPHCVVFQEDLSDPALEDLGPALATHPAFTGGTNVQLAWPVEERAVRIRIWERGVGRTSASGTSSCAVAGAAVHRGLVPPGDVRIIMDGGAFTVRVTEDLDITLRGPVREVYRGVLAKGFLTWLRQLDGGHPQANEPPERGGASV